MDQVVPGIRRLALRTPTLPPATHTNAYVLGEGALTVVDPASPWDDERARLLAALDTLAQAGERVERIFLTHHHHDHVAGAVALRNALAERGDDVPIVAHPVTADLLRGELPVHHHLDAGDRVTWGGRSFDVMHTPGHAPGHLVLHDTDSGAMVAGDMVAGVGTILIEPSEGDLGDYLDALERMAARDPAMLLPSHGPALPQAVAVLGFYVAHRHQRTEQVRAALDAHGRQTALELAPRVYAELDPAVHPIAAVQITSHLIWMERHGLARRDGDGWRVA